MTRILIIFFISSFLFSANCYADHTPPPNYDVKHTNTLTYQNISKLKNTISNLSGEIDVANSDIKLESDRFSDIQTYFEVFAALFTFLTVLFSIVGFISIRGMVKDKTESYAKEWFFEKSSDLESTINVLKRKTEDLMIDFDSFISDRKNHIERTVGDFNKRTKEPSQEKETISHDTIEKEQTEFNNHEEEIAAYDSLITQFESATEPELQERVASAILYKGITLGQLDRNEEAIVIYDSLIKKFGSAIEPELQKLVARAMLNKATRFGKLNRSEEEIAAYDALIKQFGSATEPELQGRVARAMLYKGLTFGQLDRSEEAIVTYDSLIQKFVSTTEPELQKSVAKAMLNKAIRLGKLNRSEEEIAAYNALIKQLGSATESELQKIVARAMLNKAIRLGETDS